MITMTRTGLLLTLNADTIPAQGSSDVPISFVNDPETYTGYTIQPLAGWYKNGCKQSAVCGYADDTITVPAAAFQQNGEIMLAVALIDPSDANHIEVTHPVTPTVVNAPNDPTELPDEETWQAAVDAFVEQVMQPYQTNIQGAIDTANAASQTATDTSNTINQAIQDGDFIPRISATAKQGAEGTQPSVTVTGDKATPSINFTIPKGNKGEQGIQGPKGDTGAQGPAGPSTVQNSGDTLNTFDVKGAGFFISQDDAIVTIGSYSEWLAAGSPAWPTS